MGSCNLCLLISSFSHGPNESYEGVEEDRIFQACWRFELEIEEEACNASSQRCESFHQGAMRLQGQASIQDREGVPHEETQGIDQLRWNSCMSVLSQMRCESFIGRGGRTHQAK